MAQLKFVCACATTALYMRGSRLSSTETDGQAVKTDFRSRSKGQGQFLTVKNLDRGRERIYDKCLSDHPLQFSLQHGLAASVGIVLGKAECC